MLLKISRKYLPQRKTFVSREFQCTSFGKWETQQNVMMSSLNVNTCIPEEAIRLHGSCQILDAEIYGLFFCLEYFLSAESLSQKALLASDSSAALSTICNPLTKHPLTIRTQRVYAIFLWMPSHAGGFLIKRGSPEQRYTVPYLIISLLHFIYQIF